MARSLCVHGTTMINITLMSAHRRAEKERKKSAGIIHGGNEYVLCAAVSQNINLIKLDDFSNNAKSIFKCNFILQLIFEFNLNEPAEWDLVCGLCEL